MDLQKEFERHVSKSQFDRQKLDLTEDLYFGGYKSATTRLCFHYFLMGFNVAIQPEAIESLPLIEGEK